MPALMYIANLDWQLGADRLAVRVRGRLRQTATITGRIR